MGRVFKHLPRTLVGDQEAVRQMRVAGRRLRVALPILACKPAGRRVKRALVVLRELTQAAGRGRELDVSLELLEARLRVLGTPSLEQGLLRGRLGRAVRRSRRRMADALLDVEIARLRRDLRSLVKAGPPDEVTLLGRLRETRNALGKTIAEGLGAVGNRFDPEALHRLRRQARRLRYAAEVSDVLAGRDSPAPAALKDLQNRLGAIHDNHVLGDWLSKTAARATARGQAALAAETGALAEWFDEQSRGHHRAFLERGPLQVVTRALEAMGQAARGGSMRHARRLPARSEGPVSVV
jgi:CHAD domain-containing protein